jgi:uncharacterized protein YlxP (DUF503 family)
MCHSLKEKRSVLKRLIHRLRVADNCAVAEVGEHDVWQSSEIAIVTVYNTREQVDQLFRGVEAKLNNGDDFQLVHSEIEFL